MDQYFDLHLYVAHWGTRRLMIRVPARLIDHRIAESCLRAIEGAAMRVSGENLIIDISREVDLDGEDDGSGWLATLAPLRASTMAGDLRLFYLLWLTAVETDVLAPDDPEPMPGIGPISEELEAAAAFLGLDPDLVEAAAEGSSPDPASAKSPDALKATLSALSEAAKTAMLMRVAEGDPHVAAELKAMARKRSPIASPTSRTVEELQARAEGIQLAREQEAAAKRAAEHQQRAKQAEQIRRIRLAATARRGAAVWQEIEAEIERRNASGYDKAAELLADLQAIAREQGKPEEFSRQLRQLRERHTRKERFIERLSRMG